MKQVLFSFDAIGTGPGTEADLDINVGAHGKAICLTPLTEMTQRWRVYFAEPFANDMYVVKVDCPEVAAPAVKKPHYVEFTFGPVQNSPRINVLCVGV